MVVIDVVERTVLIVLVIDVECLKNVVPAKALLKADAHSVKHFLGKSTQKAYLY